MRHPALMILLVACLHAAPAMAQNANADKPIEITADSSLEWHRAKNQYIANGNAVITQGNVTIRARKIIADYRDTAKSGTEIHRLTAIESVTIDNQGNTASGDHLVYDVDSGLATMTGDALTMTSPDQTVTAEDKFEYNVTAATLKAFGNATVIRAGDTLRAETISAMLKEDKSGKQVLDQLEAIGNVVITTPTETLSGTRGVYTASNNTAEMSGGVTIRRDQNILTGDRASIDLTSNISRIFASGNAADPIDPAADGGRVRGTFYPSKKAP